MFGKPASSTDLSLTHARSARRERRRRQAAPPASRMVRRAVAGCERRAVPHGTVERANSIALRPPT